MEKLYNINGKYISYDNIDVNKYKKLEIMSDSINKIKFISLLLLFILILFQLFFNTIPWFEFGKDKESIFLSSVVVILAYTINVLAAFVLHKKAYTQISEGNKIFKVKSPFFKKEIFKSILNYIFFIFSPDYYYAKEFKENIKRSYSRCCYKTCNKECIKDKNGKGICLKCWDGIRIDLKYFVSFSNWYNVILASMIGILTIFFWGYSGWLVNIIFYVLVFRVISRFIEIFVAFYKDVARVDDKVFATSEGKNQRYVHNWKNSLLLKSSRISLAVHSLTEIVILFSMLYYFISLNYIESGEENLISAIGSSGKLNTYNFFLFSISISAFNYSFASFNSILWSTAHVFQVMLSIVLIILALATYLGAKSDLLERDRELYLKIASDRQMSENNNT